MVYRYLRTLEGVTPPLSLTHLSCQITAKAFVATRTCASLSAPCSTLTPSLSNSFRPNVLAGATWQRAQHDPARSPEWYRRPDRSEASLPILYSETRNGPSHKAIKRGINGHFLIKTGSMGWGSPHQPHQTPLPSTSLTVTEQDSGLSVAHISYCSGAARRYNRPVPLIWHRDHVIQ